MTEKSFAICGQADCYLLAYQEHGASKPSPDKGALSVTTQRNRLKNDSL